MSDDVVSGAYHRLREFVEAEEFKGYDPYDTLNSPIGFQRFGKWIPIFAIQAQKRIPFNLRPALGIRKDINPKGIGLFLSAYTAMFSSGLDSSARSTADRLFQWLLANPSKGWSGLGWGYNFPWAMPSKYVPAFLPSIVVTSFVGRSIHEYHEATGDPRARDAVLRACQFILNELPRSRTKEGLCFSYTPVKKDCFYNANLLGAELLSRAYALTGDTSYRDTATEAVDFVMARQKEDGRWLFAIDLETGRENPHVDFHQGFKIDSLYYFIQYTRPESSHYQEALERGTSFYRQHQFFPTGRAKWRIPARWPIDIHNQAQGIISLTRLAHLDAEYLEFAETIARWTIEHMADRDGYFYYKIGRVFTNKTPFIRWGQAWMLVGLTNLLIARQRRESTPDVFS